MPKPIRVVHVISGLGMGGAENVLWNLVSQSDPSRLHHSIISLTDDGIYGNRLRSTGADVVSINFRRWQVLPANFLKMGRAIRDFRPDVIQTWLYHGDFLGTLAARIFVPTVPVFWGLHLFNLEPSINPKPIVLLYTACAVLSWKLPDAILACSDSAAQNHIQVGYARGKIRIVYNGFNTALFASDNADAAAIRRELKIPQDALVVGIVARFDPQKDHRTFLRAAKILRESEPRAHFVMCGTQITPENSILREWIRECELKEVVHLIGPRADIHRVYRAFDLASLSSLGEAMPMTIGEAMSSGVPCVATDVGDTRLLIGDTGLVVSPGDPDALAEGWKSILSLSEPRRREQGMRARDRIQRNFSVETMIAGYEKLYHDALFLEGTCNR